MKKQYITLMVLFSISGFAIASTSVKNVCNQSFPAGKYISGTSSSSFKAKFNDKGHMSPLGQYKKDNWRVDNITPTSISGLPKGVYGTLCSAAVSSNKGGDIGYFWAVATTSKGGSQGYYYKFYDIPGERFVYNTSDKYTSPKVMTFDYQNGKTYQLYKK